MNDPIRDELHRLNEEFKKLIGEPTDLNTLEKTSPIDLSKYGLTLDEAEAWLKHESDYPCDRRFLTKKRTDGDLTEPSIRLRICRKHEQ